MSTGTIHLTPFVYPDGQVQAGADEVRDPLGIELDNGWVHVCDYGTFGARTQLRSYPASEVAVIAWGTLPDQRPAAESEPSK